MEMIVGLTYDCEGKRDIASISCNYIRSKYETQEIAKMWTNYYDEVYIIDINTDYQPLIDEIVLKGCRIGV